MSNLALYAICFGIPLIFGLWAQHSIKSTFQKYSEVPEDTGMTGAQVARQILDANGLQGVPVNATPGALSDHYDPRARSVNLSEPVYGQATKHTDMTVWKRLDDGSGAGEAKLVAERTYRLEPGHAGIYDVGAIHSIDYPDKSRFVRVTGRDLDLVPRLRFDLAAGRAVTIESVSASG